MIEGAVNASYELIVPLSLRGPTGQTLEVEAVVDTGYNGLLTLPPPVVTDLGLPHRGYGEASLADGRVVEFDVYGVTALWDGQPRHIEADEADCAPLVGMRMLDRHNLNVDVAVGGQVVIRPME